MISSREAALKIIYDTFENESYLNIAYKNVTAKNRFSPIDAAFIKELAFGTVSNKITIDYILGQFIKKTGKISPYVYNILRLGIFQLKFTDKIPESAAVNESVKLAEKYVSSREKGFVNAVLRNVARAKGIKMPEKKDKNYLCVTYSFTPSMTGALVKAYGFDFTESLMQALNNPPEISVRANLLKTSRADLIESFKKSGICAWENEKNPCGILISGGGNLPESSDYKNGLFTIQDTASQLSALTLNPKAGDTVLDLCASPGGKTTHLAELMQNKGKIYAFDLYEKRLLSVGENAKRLKLDIITCEACDSTVLKEELKSCADKILLDAPCSGWGVIRRKPDIKYKSEKTDYKELVNTQKALIRTAAEYLKPGGEMVYSTCTLNKGENERVVNGFLEEFENFELISMKTYFPHIDNCDGFFISKLRKKSEDK